ncbi:alpha/beta fold hydrolase [Aeromicrobium sp. HA]|uniref:alpha/beta fold hydrolase n=1 Tax=Aeromicrobium sp. HA TaxID=3009077 RepID=UPI0022AF1AB6|nr:alpha/beta hydrolase [Aeromicrobium sp. HA]
MTTSLPEWFVEALNTEPEERQVLVDGCHVAYRAWGDGDGPPVVLVHGGGANASWWDHIAPALAADRRVIAVDLSGHGDSGRRDAYDLRLWADEVLAASDDANLVSPVAVGHSLGGLVALDMATRDVVPALTIVVDSAITDAARREWLWMRRITAKPVVHYTDRNQLLERFTPTPPDAANRPYIVEHIAARSITLATEGWRWKLDPGIFARPVSDALDLARVQGRVVVLQAERGTARTPFSKAELEILGPDATVAVVPDSGHHVMVDQPEALIDLVRQHVSAYDAARF